MELRLITLISMAAIGVHCDDHTLRYFFTGVLEPLLGLPEYFVVAYVDDKQIHRYSSDTGQLQSVAPWMSKVGPEYWERELWRAKEFHPVFRHYVRVVMRLFNQTKGFHSAQWMFGCQLRDDGSTMGYSQIGYDGRDVIFLEKERGFYIPIVHEFQFIAQEWNGPELRWGENMKGYLEIECSKQINNLIKYGKEDLERRVRPEVKVCGRRQSNSVMRLHCLVYGFHPRAVDVKWVRNEVDHVLTSEMSPILPHPDGTYQIRVSVEVPTREGDTYSCHVEHSSLEEILIVGWKPNNDLPLGVIVGTCLSAVAAVAVICGVILYIKKKLGYRSTNTSNTETSTEPSNPPRA